VITSEEEEESYVAVGSGWWHEARNVEGVIAPVVLALVYLDIDGSIKRMGWCEGCRFKEATPTQRGGGTSKSMGP
jgi:hypothetical protein